jgi:hypothetical protein
VVPSDGGPSTGGRPRRGWAVRVTLVAALVAAALVIAWASAVWDAFEANFGSGFDERRFDALEAGFDDDPAAFTAVATRMQELVAVHPGATRIGWSLNHVCVRSSTGEDTCEDTGAADQALFERLPSTDVVVHHAKDPGRTFFCFFGDDPPRYTVMYAPGDGDPQRFADDRGFRRTREVGPGWTLLGPIPDMRRETEQWLG